MPCDDHAPSVPAENLTRRPDAANDPPQAISPLLAIVVALALSGVVVASAVLGAGVRPRVARRRRRGAHEPAVARRRRQPSARPTPAPTAGPTPTPSPTPPTPHPAARAASDADAGSGPRDEPLPEGRLRQPGDEGPVRQRGDADHAQHHRPQRTIDRPRTQARLDALAEELYGHPEGRDGAKGLGRRPRAARCRRLPDRGRAEPNQGDPAGRSPPSAQTGRPVGLLVWRGAHSWVLHGYEATADPLGRRAVRRDPPLRQRPVVSADQQHLGCVARSERPDHAEAARGGLPARGGGRRAATRAWTASSCSCSPRTASPARAREPQARARTRSTRSSRRLS